MAQQRREVTKRIKNRLMLCVAMFIACGMGLLILLDSRHLGNRISRSSGVPGYELINYNVPLSKGGLSGPACIVYSTYTDVSIKKSDPIPTPAQVGRTEISAFFQSDLTPVYNKSLDFGDAFYYEIRLAMAIPDVDHDGIEDIFANLGKISNTFTISTGDVEWANLRPSFLEYYNVLFSGRNGTLINGTTLQQASFSSEPVTKAVWVDNDFAGGNELTLRDVMPDLVCIYNKSSDYFIEAYHLDLLTSSIFSRLAWKLNNSETPIPGIGTPGYQDLRFINATQQNNTMVLVTTGNRFLRFFACNGSFATYQDNIISVESTLHDFTGDGVEEIYLINESGTPTHLNISVFNLMDNSSLEYDDESLNVPTGYYREQYLFVTRPNATNPSSFPDVYIVVNYRKNENEGTYFAWHILLDVGQIRLQPLQLGQCYGIRNMELVLFDHDMVYDLVVQQLEESGTNKDLIVFDGRSTFGSSMVKLESQPALSSYSSGNSYLISDIGGNGHPDILTISSGTLTVSSFETIFFWQYTPLLTILFFLCIAGFLIGTIILIGWRRALKKATNQGLPEKLDDGTQSPQLDAQGKKVKVKRSPLTKALMGFIIFLVGITLPFIAYQRLQSAGEPILSENVQLIHLVTAVMLAFFAMIPVVAVLYNITAPTYATSIYIKAQAKFFRMQPGKHDYRVLVLDFGTRNKRSVASYITRCIFPISLAITLGLTLFQTFYSGPALTGFSGSSGMMDWIVNFELYCCLPIILAFGLASFLVPSSWLLDDAGVVFFIENLVLREPGDISKISEWFLKYIKAVAGFTAIFSYFQLFQNTNFIVQTGGEESNVFMDIILTIVIITLIVGFPFIGGFLYMLIAQITVENNLPTLKQILFRRMNEMGIDTTPRQLRDVLDPKDRCPKEFVKVWKKGKLNRKEETSPASAGINPPPQP